MTEKFLHWQTLILEHDRKFTRRTLTFEHDQKNNSFEPDNPCTLVFAHYTSARRWYAPHELAKVNNSEIERATEMDI